MKNILTICLSVFLFTVFSTESLAQDKKFKLVSSASMFSDMLENLVTKDFEIKTIVPIGGDPHKYRARPSDAQMVQKADLIFVNGLTFEGWIKDLIANSGSKGETITITKGIQPISSLQYENSSDPHAWMDVQNVLVYIKNMKDALQKLDPTSTEEIDKNYETYKAKLEQLDADIQNKINSIPEKQRVLITSHDAFQYYGEKYGLRLEAIMGISTEAAAQTSDIIRVSKAIKSNNVPAIFIESTINPKMINQIAKDNKVSIGGELYADSLGDKDSKGSTYIDMMWHNTITITEALSKTISTSQKSTEDSANNDSLTDGLSTPFKVAVSICLLLLLAGIIITKLRKS